MVRQAHARDIRFAQGLGPDGSIARISDLARCLPGKALSHEIALAWIVSPV
jgi:hypothetical protein